LGGSPWVKKTKKTAAKGNRDFQDIPGKVERTEFEKESRNWNAVKRKNGHRGGCEGGERGRRPVVGRIAVII